MREETRRRLERQLWISRLKQGAMALAGAAVLAGLIVLAYSKNRDDPLVAEQTVGGTVKFWTFTGRQSAQGNTLISLTVHLDSGRDVQAGSSTHASATQGEHIDLNERRYQSGRLTYVWK
jgi:hypothetical protein